MSLRILAIGGVVVTTLVGCAAAQPRSDTAPPPVRTAISASGVTGLHNGRPVVYALAGNRWTLVPLPHLPAAGASVQRLPARA